MCLWELNVIFIVDTVSAFWFHWSFIKYLSLRLSTWPMNMINETVHIIPLHLSVWKTYHTFWCVHVGYVRSWSDQSSHMLTRCLLGNIQSHTPATHPQNLRNTWILSEKEQMSNTHTHNSIWWTVSSPLISYSISRIKRGRRPDPLSCVCVCNGKWHNETHMAT